MQDLGIYNSQLHEMDACRDAGLMIAHEGAAGEFLLHTWLHEEDWNAFLTLNHII